MIFPADGDHDARRGILTSIPDFALKRDIGCYVGYTREDGSILGVLVFTTLEKLHRYQERFDKDAIVKAFEDVSIFRQFLKGLREQGAEVRIDYIPDRRGRMRSLHTISAAVLLEHFLPPPGFIWSYPVFVLENKSNFACLEGSRDGKMGMWLKVFTDSHLAERALARYGANAFAVREMDRSTFEQMSQALHTVCVGVVFDPPEVGQDRPPAFSIFCEELLALLSIRL